MLSDPLFPQSMNENDKEVWILFADVIHNCLENRNDIDYKNIVERMLIAYKARAVTSGPFYAFIFELSSEKQQGERFYYDLRRMEKT